MWIKRDNQVTYPSWSCNCRNYLSSFGSWSSLQHSSRLSMDKFHADYPIHLPSMHKFSLQWNKGNHLCGPSLFPKFPKCRVKISKNNQVPNNDITSSSFDIDPSTLDSSSNTHDPIPKINFQIHDKGCGEYDLKGSFYVGQFYLL